MVMTRLPPDFKEFLKLLSEHDVRYLLVGGYAVAYYGYSRATHDMDIWVAAEVSNAAKMIKVMRAFGFAEGAITADLFTRKDGILRLGVPPVRLEILNEVSGVEFDFCYRRAIVDDVDGVPVRIIHLDDLRANKLAAGRHKDLDDLENLPDRWPG